MSESNQPIIIKKIKKGGHGAHGGAWKLAYADFVTAMMAFFLLLWLLGSVDQKKLRGIAEYFKDPWKPSLSGGEAAGDTVSIIKGGGDDITQSDGQVKMTNEGKREQMIEASEADTQAIIEDEKNLEQLEQKIQALIKTNPLLQQFDNQIKIDITAEGLRIQIIDQEKRPMFALASARMEPYAAQILDQIAPVINELPNRISITGHTDATPFPGSGAGYTNWELSADRANAARKELVRGGLKEEKIMRVIGLASSVALVKDHPSDPINRRIAIIVMNKETVDAILGNGRKVDVSSGSPINRAALTPGYGKAVEPSRTAPPAPPASVAPPSAKP
ncbi:flagellar motor protein MotB [Methylococcus sp. EFPC2]|uniref:flagellar motor protein MotB n=1 Tax=Methylococcus sp. EFPC2 TaxID=2812648 RepID=UPI0019671774|nr:flagellar motor protein MotB [Methylococcus sp. EFPC2]QSA98694.1 flagellar motor protein MotB [Methylococcus sp. EFPC2]